MKKFFAIVFALLCGVISAFTMTACADVGAPDYSTDKSGLVVSVERIEEITAEFAAIEDRTTYTSGEKRAADYLHGKLIDYGFVDAEIIGFSLTDNNYQVDSQNVKAVYRSANAGDGAKNVIIGAYYDNRYGETAGYTRVGSTGAIGNCTGVAATLAIAEYLQAEKPDLDYTVTIVFFGAGAVASYGAQNYYRNMTAAERADTVLMVELQRLGFEHVYAFSDERKTRRETFFDGVAADNKLNIYKPTEKSPIVTGMYALEGVPFYRWAHTGIFTPFFNNGIPTLNLIGANWETLDITDNDRITITESDTYENMLRDYPCYAENTAVAASFMIKALEADGFLAAMQYDRDNFPNTDVLNMDWIWPLIVLCSVLLGAVAMYLVSSRLAKKYPIVAPQPKTVKMAVFGMEYEDKNAADIFVDVKRVSPTEDIFPGIPNNDAAGSAGDTFDPFGLNTVMPSVLSGNDPFEAASSEAQQRAESVTDESEKAQTEDPTHAAEATERDAEKETAAPIEAAGADGDSASAEGKVDSAPVAAKKPRASKPAASKPAADKAKLSGGATKRKTVSAGKSVHGGKPTADKGAGESKSRVDGDDEK